MRGALGGRVAWNLPPWRMTPVLRGGVYHRWGFGESAGAPVSSDPQGSGWYAGLGVEFVPYTDALAHLFATTYVPFTPGEPDEVIIGIGVTSHY